MTGPPQPAESSATAGIACAALPLFAVTIKQSQFLPKLMMGKGAGFGCYVEF